MRDRSTAVAVHSPARIRACALPLGIAVLAAGLSLGGLVAQTPPSQVPVARPLSGQRSAGRGLRAARRAHARRRHPERAQTNLGVILSGTQTAAARGERLSQLQALLPSVDFNTKEADMQVDLPAEGLRIPGFPKIIGPFGYTDLRAILSWSLIDVASLRNYLAARHNFAAATLSAQDAREMVVLVVGNAYLLALGR